MFVFGLVKLVGLVIGENGNGDSEDDGDWDKGWLPSIPELLGRWIWEGGRGIGTPCVVGRGMCVDKCMIEVEGEEDVFEYVDDDLLCVGWE